MNLPALSHISRRNRLAVKILYNHHYYLIVIMKKQNSRVKKIQIMWKIQLIRNG